MIFPNATRAAAAFGLLLGGASLALAQITVPAVGQRATSGASAQMGSVKCEDADWLFSDEALDLNEMAEVRMQDQTYERVELLVDLQFKKGISDFAWVIVGFPKGRPDQICFLESRYDDPKNFLASSVYKRFFEATRGRSAQIGLFPKLRAANARYALSYKDGTGKRIEEVAQNGNRFYRVFITGFPTRAAAQAYCRGAGSDCLVR